jgi:putative transposase
MINTMGPTACFKIVGGGWDAAVVGRFTAFRFTIDASAGQNVVLARHAGAARFAFNQCLAMVKDALDAKTRDSAVVVPWSGFDLINAFNQWKRSAAAGRVWTVDTAGTATVHSVGLSWRTQVCQQVFEEAAVDCGRALAAFADSRRGKRVGFPRFKRKTATVGSFRIRQKTSAARAAIRVGDPMHGPRSVTLPTIGVLRVREDTRRLRRMLANGRARIVCATVSCRAGRWSVSLTVQAADLHPAHHHPQPGEPGGAAGWVGVDRGLAAYVVAADRRGNELLRIDTAPKAFKAGLPKIRRLSRQVSRKRRGSANRRKAGVRLARCHRRIADVRRHFLHEVANELVQTHDQLALEDLNIAGMLRNHHLAAAISDAAWAELARIVTYKQQWRRGHTIMVDRWFPSSKTCAACGAIRATLTLADREFCCPVCGHTADRDLNAATNLAIWAEQHHAQVRDPQVRGPVINAHRGDGSGRRTSARRRNQPR